MSDTATAVAAESALGLPSSPALEKLHDLGDGTNAPVVHLDSSAVTAASTIADGADVAEGSTTDAAVTTNTTGTISGKLRGLVAIVADVWDSVNHWLKVQLQAGEAHVGTVSGTTGAVSDSFARPADTTAYTAGDAVAAATTDSGTTALRSLTGIGRVNGGSGYLTKFRLWTDQSTCTARFRVHFYTVSAPAAVVPGDNAAMTLKWANRSQRIGTIDFAAMTTEQSGSDAAHAQDANTRMAYKCAVADTSLYYRVETLDAFTPASGQNFFLEVVPEQN